MSVLEAMQEQDAELAKQIKDQEEPEVKIEEKVEEAPEPKEEELVEEKELEDDGEAEEEEEEAVEEDDDKEDSPKDKAKKGWKVRQELKEAKQRADDLEKKINDMNSTLQTAGITPQQIAQAKQQQLLQQQQQANPEPDKDLDRDAWYEWKIGKLENQGKQHQVDLQEQQQRIQIQQAKQELRGIESDYRKGFSQYDDAKEFLKTSYKHELKLQYPQATDAQLNEEIDIQELQLAGNAVNGGMNAAEAIKRMAEARGFIAKTETATKKQKPNITKMAQNQKRSVNMINQSGDAKKEKLNVNDILEMSFDDRLKMSNKDWADTEQAYDWGQR